MIRDIVCGVMAGVMRTMCSAALISGWPRCRGRWQLAIQESSSISSMLSVTVGEGGVTGLQPPGDPENGEVLLSGLVRLGLLLSGECDGLVPSLLETVDTVENRSGTSSQRRRHRRPAGSIPAGSPISMAKMNCKICASEGISVPCKVCSSCRLVESESLDDKIL